jgi:hypothetical protein
MIGIEPLTQMLWAGRYENSKTRLLNMKAKLSRHLKSQHKVNKPNSHIVFGNY